MLRDTRPLAYEGEIPNIGADFLKEPMLNLNHLTKMFGEFTAVDDLTLAIPKGEFFGFLGPNGAGKTTTIKMMTGLFSPTSGSIVIDGHDIEKDPLKAKLATGYIPDQPFLYEKLTGREFLYFSAGLYRLEHELASSRIGELTELFEIGSWIDRRAENYSQGMRQRLVIVAALLHRPRLLVIDEPIVGLDPRSTVIVKRFLRDLADSGTTIFMSTHSLSIVEELCDRIGIIKNGKLVFEDATDAFHLFKDKHNGSFEATFLELTR